MGLNSGEVVVGKIGDDLRMDYTAQGHAVGLAARMEQIAAAESIYISEHTAKLVSGYFQLRDLGETRVKGLNALFGAGAVQRARTVSGEAIALAKRQGQPVHQCEATIAHVRCLREIERADDVK